MTEIAEKNIANQIFKTLVETLDEVSRQQAVIASPIRVGDEMADKLNGLEITAFDHEWAKCKSWLEEGGEG